MTLRRQIEEVVAACPPGKSRLHLGLALEFLGEVEEWITAAELARRLKINRSQVKRRPWLLALKRQRDGVDLWDWCEVQRHRMEDVK